MVVTDRRTASRVGSSSTVPEPGRVRPGRNRARVIVVDDDLGFLETLADWLRDRCGAEVTTFASAEEAMVAVRPGSFDICVLDYRLTGANGLTLGAMLREINPDAQLILLSGQLSATIESLALEHGFGNVFEKPCPLEMLARAVSH